MFQYFSFFFFEAKENQKRNWRRETKTDNEKWKLIEERARDKKNKLCQYFLEADKGKNNNKGFKNQSYKNKHKKHYSEKKLSKKKRNWQKKTFVRQDNREEIFPCFWKRVTDSEKNTTRK